MSILNLLMDEYESRVKKNTTAKKEESSHLNRVRLNLHQNSIVTNNATRPVSMDNCCASASKSVIGF